MIDASAGNSPALNNPAVSIHRFVMQKKRIPTAESAENAEIGKREKNGEEFERIDRIRSDWGGFKNG
jgi:hypothetical protein